jgi:hypothetical protein
MRKTWAAAALALVLAACGGGTGSADSTALKGYGPAQLYHPTANPAGHVLLEGDTGIVFLPQAVGGSAPAPLQVWFETASASAYAVEMEDEDLPLLARVQLVDAAGQTLLSVDGSHRAAHADLVPGRYALQLTASATHPESTPLFVRFDTAAAPAKPLTASAKADPLQMRKTVLNRNCDDCDLSGANLTLGMLPYASLQRANLSGAYLLQTRMPYSILEGANLSSASMRGVDLENAYLMNANLSGADLRRANLRGARLDGANLSGAKLGDATWVDGRTCALESPPGECH